MTEDAKQKLVDILSKSPDLIGQDSSFFGSASKPNEANLKLFMKFARGLKNSGTLSKETVNTNEFINFLSKTGKSEEELGKIRSSLKELSSRSQIVETPGESTLFNVADTLLAFKVKGDKTISRFQTALKSLSSGPNIEEGAEEESQEEKSSADTEVTQSTADTKEAKKDTPEDSSYSGSYDEGGVGQVSQETGATTESTTESTTEIAIETKTNTIGTYAIMNTESTVTKYPDLPQSLKDIKPRELRDKDGKLIGFISDDESNKSVYDQSGEIIGQLDPTNKSVGGFEGLSVVLKPKAPTPTTPPATPQTPQLREAGSGAGPKRIPTESKGPVTGPTSKVPTGLGADKKLTDIPESLRKRRGKKKPGRKRFAGIPGRGRKLLRELTPKRTQKATATATAKTKTKEKDEQTSPLPTNSRQTQTVVSSGGRRKKKKSKVGKIALGSSFGIGAIIKSTMPATAATLAGEIFKQIIQIIT